MTSLQSQIPWAIDTLDRAGERGIKWLEQSLTDNEEELLLLAEDSGEPIMVIKTGQTGEFIMVGRKAYYSVIDGSVQEAGLKALALLHERQLVRSAQGKYYELTSAGIRKARSLK
jgi:hypothetical protein